MDFRWPTAPAQLARPATRQRTERGGTRMKWVTFQGDSGERVGVLSGDAIHPVAPGTSLLELIARGAAGLREAGEEALRSTPALPLGAVRLAAPIPRPPSIRDSLCFLDHMRNCQAAM